MKMTLGAKKFGVPFVPIMTDYVSETIGAAATFTVPVPAGATECQIEIYSSGGAIYQHKRTSGANGGNYVKKNKHNIAALGYGALYISVRGPSSTSSDQGDAFVRQNNSGGSVLAYSTGGLAAVYGAPSASGCIGDVINLGGEGRYYDYFGGFGGGGGCGGPVGAGSPASGDTGGAGGGGMAGAGGTAINSSSSGNGQQYGGGFAGKGLAPILGGRGLVRITWS